MPNTREKLIEIVRQKEAWLPNVGTLAMQTLRFVDHLITNGVTVQKWIPVTEDTPTESDGTVWVCLADKFPYNQPEPFVNAKHDRRITEAHYSQFSKIWYQEGAVLPDGVVTHWMKKCSPPKGDCL